MSEESLSYNFQMKSRELIANLNSKRVIAKNIYLLGLLVGAGIAFYVHTKYGFTFDPIFLGIDAAIVFGSAGAVAIINTFTFYRSYKNLFKDKILTSMTKTYDSQWSLVQKKNFEREDVLRSGISIKQKHDFNHNERHRYMLTTDNSIVGTANDLSFKLAQVDLTYETRTEDHEGEEERETETIFQGIFCELDLNENYNKVVIRPIALGGIGIKLEKMAHKIFGSDVAQIKTQNHKFNEKFCCFSKDEELAHQILNEHNTLLMLDLVNRLEHHYIDVVINKNKAYFAIKSGKNFLAPPLFKALDHSIIDTIESTFDTYRDLLHILSSVQDQTSSAAS